MTLLMIILICVGCAIALGGLVVLALGAIGLFKAARQAGISSADEIAQVVRRAQRLEPQLRELERRQKVVAGSVQRLSTTTGRLNYLKEELDRSTGHISKLKS